MTSVWAHPNSRDRSRWVTHFPWVADPPRPGCLLELLTEEDNSLAPTQCVDKRVIACLCGAVWLACIHKRMPKRTIGHLRNTLADPRDYRIWADRANFFLRPQKDLVRPNNLRPPQGAQPHSQLDNELVSHVK